MRHPRGRISFHRLRRVLDHSEVARVGYPILQFMLWLIPRLAVILLAVLSLVPGWLRPHTGLPNQAEHFLAYFLTALMLATRGRSRAYWVAVMALLCIYAGILEILQIWIPGRDSQLTDFVASSIGALCGTWLWILIVLRWQRFAGRQAGRP
jgi:VanZ family protein